VVRDITDQKLAEEARQNSLLLKEIHNRVKNHLQVIRSFSDTAYHQSEDDWLAYRGHSVNDDERVSAAANRSADGS